MSSISKSTLKFFKENITNENSKFIPVFRDIREIIREFREWFPIVFKKTLRLKCLLTPSVDTSHLVSACGYRVLPTIS